MSKCIAHSCDILLCPKEKNFVNFQILKKIPDYRHETPKVNMTTKYFKFRLIGLYPTYTA
jgi:hypothetical protein